MSKNLSVRQISCDILNNVPKDHDNKILCHNKNMQGEFKSPGGNYTNLSDYFGASAPMPVAPVQYSELNSLSGSLNTISNVQRSSERMWDPYVRMQLAKEESQNGVSPHTYGDNIYNRYSNPNFQQVSFPEKSLFFQNYINPNDATVDYRKSLQNTAEVHKPLKIPAMKACHVFPPLLLRYEGREDHYIPVEILPAAELKITQKVPDVVLNFHADTKAINFTICHTQPEKVNDLKIFVSVVYSLMEMDSQKIDVKLFTLMYDQARYSYLKRMGLFLRNKK